MEKSVLGITRECWWQISSDLHWWFLTFYLHSLHGPQVLDNLSAILHYWQREQKRVWGEWPARGVWKEGKSEVFSTLEYKRKHTPLSLVGISHIPRDGCPHSTIPFSFWLFVLPTLERSQYHMYFTCNHAQTSTHTPEVFRPILGTTAERNTAG